MLTTLSPTGRVFLFVLCGCRAVTEGLALCPGVGPVPNGHVALAVAEPVLVTCKVAVGQLLLLVAGVADALLSLAVRWPRLDTQRMGGLRLALIV
jgi:hypothetical protein